MNFKSKIGVTLLCTVSSMALTSVVLAQEANTESVVVTGSRVISDAINSPTPLTVLDTA